MQKKKVARTPSRRLPKPGEVFRTNLPDSMEGIRYEIGRMTQYVQESRRDPVVIATARKIATLALDAARLDGRETPECSGDRDRWILEGLHAWGRSNFEYVNDPVGVEVIQTPARMLRELEIPVLLQKQLWGQIASGMVKKQDWTTRIPLPKIAGDSDEAATLALSLAAAVGYSVKWRFGGSDGSIHYAWGAARVGTDWVDIDFLHKRFGAHHPFEHVEDLDLGF